MNTETTTIDLPPPRRDHRRRRPSGGRLLWVIAALAAGAAAGLYFGKQWGGNPPEKQPVATGAVEGNSIKQQQEIDLQVQAAKDALSQGDWIRMSESYKKVLEMDPENPMALTALPLIDLHLDQAHGGVIVTTVPEGATVKLGSHGEAKSRAQFSDVPLGAYMMEISLEGYETLKREVRVAEESVMELDPIELVRSSGSLTLSSEPNGVDFQLIRVDDLPEPEKLEVIETGRTPALIEKLDPGEYRVNLLLKGWPGYSEKVSVEHNRKSSVSHVFARGGLNITSRPDGAEIFLTTDPELGPQSMGVTPENLLSDIPVGRHKITLKYGDWPPIERMIEVREGETTVREFEWPRAPVAFTSNPAGAEIFNNDKRIGGERKTPFTMEFPEGDHTFVARFGELSPVIRGISVAADDEETQNKLHFDFEYGSIVIESQPSGAAVIHDGVPLGRTPYRVNIAQPGPYTYQISKAQHKGTTVSGEVLPGQSLRFNARLTFNPAPSSRSDFDNVFGMKMVWVENLKGWVGAHEVTMKAFTTVMNKNPDDFDFPGDDLPAHGVSWYDADSFCKLLTASEKGRGRLPKGYTYQLPTDRQWSEFVGNAPLESAVTSLSSRQPQPSPVGSLKPNEYGLYDVRGNVWEWCQDWYTNAIVNESKKAGVSANADWAGTERKVLRGGSWSRSTESELNILYRLPVRPSDEHQEAGFRVVLMPD